MATWVEKHGMQLLKEKDVTVGVISYQGNERGHTWKVYRQGGEQFEKDAMQIVRDWNWSLGQYIRRQWAWSKETFGPGQRTKGVIDHIKKELKEIEKEPDDLEEWTDVIILAMDGFWRHGGTPELLTEILDQKQRKNFAREWPDWRTMSEDKAIEHDRSNEKIRR